MTTELIYREECFQIMGACFEVYNRLGSGFLEAVYSEALAIEFKHRSIAFKKELQIQISYRDQVLSQLFRADFVCLDKVLVEIKATESIVDDHRAQLLNYLNATDFKLGLLVNFGSYPKLEWERLANSRSRQEGSVPPSFPRESRE